MFTSLRLWVVLVSLCGLAGVVQAQDPANSGRIVFVDLPSGATVRAGSLDRLLERDAQGRPYIHYPVGRMDVFIAVPGERRARARIDVEEGAETRVRYRPLRFSVSRAGYAVLLPGLPQLLDGRPGVSAGIAVGLGASIGGVVWAGHQMEEARLEAEVLRGQYELATTEADAVAARVAHALALEDAKAARTTRIAFVGVSAAVYAAAVFDGLRHHTRGSTIDVWKPDPPAVALRPTSTGLTLQVRL